jgi:hypothetical protein
MLANCERSIIEQILVKTQGSKTEAARRLGLSKSAVHLQDVYVVGSSMDKLLLRCRFSNGRFDSEPDGIKRGQENKR